MIRRLASGIALLSLALGGCGGGSADDPDPISDTEITRKRNGTGDAGKTNGTKDPPPIKSNGPSQDDAAKAAFEGAKAIESSDPAAAINKYLHIRVRYPSTRWAREAESRSIALEKKHASTLKAAWEKARKGARALAAEGKFALAFKVLQDTKDARAPSEIADIENRARKEFNAVAKLGSIEEFRKLKERTLPELKSLCDEAIESLQQVAKDRAEFEKKRKEHDTGKLTLQRCKLWWADLRGRDYDKVLKEFDAGEADRKLIEAARDFWKAFLKGRAGADRMHLLDVKKKPFIAKPKDVKIEELHRDSIAAIALMELDTADAMTYVKSAMWYWFEGDEKSANREIDTANELGDIEAYEEAYRGGWLRTAISE